MKKTPHEWRKLKGTRMSHYAAANVIYRWEEHAYHWGAYELTEQDYDKALGCLSPGNYHAPAMAKGNN